MRNHTVSIYVSSPVIAEGLRSILRSMDGLSVEICRRPSRPTGSVVLADSFTVSDCGTAAKTLGVLTGQAPCEVLSRFDETVSVFDSPASITAKLRDMLAPRTEDKRCDELSPREKDVISHIARGLSNKEIASSMNVSVNTVMTHRRNIAAKLHIHSPAGITIFALATGLVKMEEIEV